MEMTARAAAGEYPPLLAPSLGRRQVEIGRRELLAGLSAIPLAASVLTRSAKAAAGISSTDILFAPGLRLPFIEAGETGVVAFDNDGGKRVIVSDFERAKRQVPPASTFKIPNTVVALETGVVASLDEPVFKWDGKVRTIDGKPVEAWNRDQPLREAFRNSTVWVYQEVARRVGAERMARLVTAFDYGNRTIGKIDDFWLVGPLAISPIEQIAFLARLKAGSLPASERAMALTREVMVLEECDGHVLSGKTGWAYDQKIGWFVGWIETGNRSRPFALNLDVTKPSSLAARTEILKTAARQIGAL
jgi:beta-lactamase class D